MRYIPFKQLFQMNFQQHRNIPSFSSLPQFNTAFLPNQIPLNKGQSQQYQIERQPSGRNNPVKLPFNLKEYSYEMKEYLRPQQSTLNAPLTFNLQTPTKLKAKKSNQLTSKPSNKSYTNHQYSRQLQNEFFKNQTNPMTTILEDFSKTTSTINGQSILNMQQTLKDSHEEAILTPLKHRLETEPGKVVHSNSLKVLFQREPENKYAPNTINHSNSSYFQRPIQTTSSKSRQNAYILDQRFLLEQIKVLKEMNENYQKQIMKINENYLKQIGRLNMEIKSLKSIDKKEELRSSRKENLIQAKQLELQYQQNGKLLRQIEQMEKDLKGKMELNRFLEQKCNAYNEKYEKLQQEFDNYKDLQTQQSTKQEQFINFLQKQINDVENDKNNLKLSDKASKEQILQLKKSLQLQSEKMQEMYTNSEIFKSQINLLSKKLQNLQNKYQKLMHSHCEAELKFHHFEESKKQQLAEYRQKNQQLIKRLRQMEVQLNKVSEEKQDLYMQLSTSKGQLIQTNNKISQIKQYYQGQNLIISQQLTQANNIVKAKSQQNDHLQLKLEAKVKQMQGFQNKIRQLTPSVQQLWIKTEQNIKFQTLLKYKQQEFLKLQEKQAQIQEKYKKISQQLQQKGTIILDLNKRYQSLKNNYQSQSARYKQLQNSLIQNEFDYNMMQRQFTEHSLKYNTIQTEYDNLKQLYKGLQLLNDQSITQERIEKDNLKIKNAELVQKIQCLYSEYNQFKKVHDDLQRQTLNTQLAQSCKSEVQTWQLVSKKQIQIEALQTKIKGLEQALQQQTRQLTRQIQQSQKIQVNMKDQISSLMLIISENQSRDKSQRDQLQEKITKLNEKISQITQKHTQEQSEYQNIILELKQSIQKLQKQDQIYKVNEMKTQIAPQQLQLRKWNSLNKLDSSQSIDSPSKQRKIQSASQLCDNPSEIDYIQMDRDGINYLCELLHIEISSGNILNQIVVQVENAINEAILSRKTEESYRQVLHAFGVQDSSGSFENLMKEITTFKQGLGMVIEQLTQQQVKNQTLRAECIAQRMTRQSQQIKLQRLVQEIHIMAQLNRDLNETVVSLTAKLCNSKMKMLQAISIAKVPISESSIHSDKFVTAKSIDSCGQSLQICQTFEWGQ